MLVPNKNPQIYKEYVILFMYFDFGEGFTIIYWITNMKLYVSDIEESYKYTTIGNSKNSGTSDLLLHIVQFWSTCAVDEETMDLPMILY